MLKKIRAEVVLVPLVMAMVVIGTFAVVVAIVMMIVEPLRLKAVWLTRKYVLDSLWFWQAPYLLQRPVLHCYRFISQPPEL